MISAKSILDVYQSERKKYEELIFKAIKAPIPDSIPIHKKWAREPIEREKDKQERYVNQLRQQYNTMLRNLDVCINQSDGINKNQLINQKLLSLTQELDDRSVRDQKLTSEIERAIKPVHSGERIWREDRIYLQLLQNEVKQEIIKLQQLILQTTNELIQ